MKTDSTYYIDLISRYFYGEVSPEEIHELEVWTKEDQANAKLFSEYHKTWKAIEYESLDSATNLDNEWNSLKNRLSDRSEVNLKPMTNSENSEFVTRHSSFVTHHLSLVTRHSSFTGFLRIAAIFLLLLIPAFFLYRYFTTTVEQTLIAGNSVIEQVLPDGTRVTLNTGATLSFPNHFKGSFRTVKLQGEAWFEVAHDKKKPFIIASENTRIRVVGTTFFVNTQTSGNTKEIILSSGIVRVYYANKPQKMALLYPGDKAIMSSGEEEITKTTNDDVNYLSWKTKHMVFNNSPLNEVSALLTKVYQTHVILSDNRLIDCRITATFDNQTLESVLNVLKATLDLRVRNTAAGIELSGNGCRQGQ